MPGWAWPPVEDREQGWLEATLPGPALLTPDRCQEDRALPPMGARDLLGFLSPLALTLLSLGGRDSRVLHSPSSPPWLG